MPRPTPSQRTYKSTHLSPSPHPDDDNASIRSFSDQDTDSSDDAALAARTTAELSEHDRSVLQEEEDLERLLTKQNAAPPPLGLKRIFSGSRGDDGERVRIGRREKRREKQRRRRRKRRGHSDEEGELMFEMEERGFKDDSESGRSSDASDEDRRKFDTLFNSKVYPVHRMRVCCALANEWAGSPLPMPQAHTRSLVHRHSVSSTTAGHIQGVSVLSRKADIRCSYVQWDLRILANDYSDLTGRLSSRLPQPGSYTNSEFLHRAGRITSLHAT